MLLEKDKTARDVSLD